MTSGQRATPCLYNIPAGTSFADALAGGLLSRWSEDLLGLSRVTLLLPTRRACRTLQEAFLRASAGRPLLLPRLMPLGDLDAEELALRDEEIALGGCGVLEIPPALPPLQRQLLLTQLILKRGAADGGPAPSEDQAVALAAELARLIDQVENEGRAFDGLADLVPADYAAHWQETLEFLKIVTEHWPAIQAERGTIGAAERRRRLTLAQAEAWRSSPPEDPVIVAGSTGSIPATAELISVVARLPQGMVVLPGLDQESDDAVWREIAEDPAHPQFGLAELLRRLDVDRAAVVPWPDSGAPRSDPARMAFLSMALRPAAATTAWPDFANAVDGSELAAALAGLARIDCPGPGEEALAIALLLRQALEVPERTAALVTPDRGLARRVAAELARWDIAVDDSAGQPLAMTPPGAFLRLSADAAATELAPVPLLALLKHPLAAGGQSPGAFRRDLRAFERAILHGPRPAPGLAGLTAALSAAEAPPELQHWLAKLSGILAPFLSVFGREARDLAEILDAHIQALEALAATAEETGPARLWAGEAGEAAAGFIDELRDAADAGPRLRGARYGAVLSALMAGRMVRPRYGRHPRLAILGPLEARLQHADLLVLGGLNEGTWPAVVEAGPWLSRPMQRDFGLPLPERRIGLAAHDFAQACAAPQVMMTRAAKVEGTPAVPSRWLLRLEALRDAVDLGDAQDWTDGRWSDWAAQLDAAPYRRSPAPAPCPPLEARPRELSVTRIETWMRDPYGLYADKILRLRALDPLDADPGAAERGTLVHEALERFVRAYPDRLPPDPAAALIAVGREVFAKVKDNPGIWAIWWPRFCRVADWFVQAESARRAALAGSYVEVAGTLVLPGPGGPFKLTAKADRIDSRTEGGLVVLDYKTGAPPAKQDIEAGLAPQLPLEAAIAAAGGFAGVPRQPVAALEFWRLSGGSPAGEIKPVKADPGGLAETALAGLGDLIARFDDPATPYLVQPRPALAPRFNDYAHLERIREWAAGQDDGSAGGGV